MEVLNKKVSFHMTDGSRLEVTGALSDVEGMLMEKPEFLKTHRSYLVNLSCVQEISGGFAVTGAGRVPVSRQRRGQVRTAWLQFVKQAKNGLVSGNADEAAFEKAKRRQGPWRILLVDDDSEQCRIWADVLRGHGCMVSMAQNGREAVSLAGREPFDGVLLDVMLPGEDGYSICRRLRKETGAPVIFLSCLTEADRQMEGFAAGGIDYITKDTPAELFWTKVRTRMELAASAECTWSLYDPLLLDLTERKAFVEGKELSLTPVEFDVLWMLAGRAGHVFTPKEIFDAIWGKRFFIPFSNRFEPIRFFWQFEWCGLFLIVVFGAMMVSNSRRILRENELLTNHLEERVDLRTKEVTELLKERKAFFPIWRMISRRRYLPRSRSLRRSGKAA